MGILRLIHIGVTISEFRYWIGDPFHISNPEQWIVSNIFN